MKATAISHEPWNKGKLFGQKAPLRIRDIRAIRVRLHAKLRSEDLLFPSRLAHSEHISTRQYARIVKAWVTAVGLDPALYGTHYPAANQGVADLPQDKEPQGRAALTGPCEAGKHWQVPWHRGRRRSGDSRADRGLAE